MREEKYTVSAMSTGNLFGLVSMLDNEWQGVCSGVDRAEPSAKSPAVEERLI